MTSRDDYRDARERFDHLPLAQKLEFLLEASASTFARGIEKAGASVADEVEQAFRTAAETARDAAQSARRAARDAAEMADDLGETVRQAAHKAAEDVADATEAPRTRTPHTPSPPTGSAAPPPAPDPAVTHYDTPDRRTTPDSSHGAAEASSMPEDSADPTDDEVSPLA